MLRFEYGKTIETAMEVEKMSAVSKAVMNEIGENWDKTREAYKDTKQTSYLSAEFLMGRALGNNMINLGIYEDVKIAVDELGINLNALEELEEDAGLGNGGLGRLAACFLDSSASENLPVTGYGIRYGYGLFKQKFVDGYQCETVDNWLKYGDPWSVRRTADAVEVAFSDGIIKAVPYDMPIIGYGTNNINTLRLWQGEGVEAFDFELFNDQKYDEALALKNKAEDISRVLYPNDSEKAGKILRLKQQYFFVSASLQDMVKVYKEKHSGDFTDFHKYYAIQLNDTHPAVAIPELMRILVDLEKVSWEDAWAVVVKTCSYTNHTILAEALEQWWKGFYIELLPRVFEIIEKINEQLISDLEKRNYSQSAIDRMKIIDGDMIKMAWLSIYGTNITNGVAELHTELLKSTELHDWYELYPERFQNKTNGITQRRWLALCNRELSSYISELLGDNKWVTDLSQLRKLEQFADDESVLNKFLEIKSGKKVALAKYILEKEGIEIDPNSIFDVQIKRLHEYKRQLLNAFHILDLYNRLKADQGYKIHPVTFIFGAKAAPGYTRAKAIIKFINEIAKLVNNDAHVSQFVKVVFVENYKVSYAEKIFPAADVSEQISTAGKEASGTGNMKFMLNGATTIGTLDGANVEIVEEAGAENNFIFGAKVEELEAIKDTYEPKGFYMSVPGLKAVVDTLIDVTFDDEKDVLQDIYNSLLKGASWHKADNYFIFKDFEDYRRAQSDVNEAYIDRLGWAKKCWMNIAGAGKFSSDRTIRQYANEIWHIEAKKIK